MKPSTCFLGLLLLGVIPASALAERDPIAFSPALLPGESPDDLPARAPRQPGRADTLDWGGCQLIGGEVYAVRGGICR